jgi:hypothetical protein
MYDRSGEATVQAGKAVNRMKWINQCMTGDVIFQTFE